MWLDWTNFPLVQETPALSPDARHHEDTSVLSPPLQTKEDRGFARGSWGQLRVHVRGEDILERTGRPLPPPEQSRDSALWAGRMGASLMLIWSELLWNN